MEHTLICSVFDVEDIYAANTINSLFNITISDAKVLDSDMEMGTEETPVNMDDKMGGDAEGIMQLYSRYMYLHSS